MKIQVFMNNREDDINRNIKMEHIEYIFAKHPAYIKMLLLEAKNKINSLLKGKMVKNDQKNELILEELNKLVTASRVKKLYNLRRQNGQKYK